MRPCRLARFCAALVLYPLASVPQAQDPAAAAPTPTAETATPSPGAVEGRSTNAKDPRRTEQLNLDASRITGAQELPKVLYIVPWKRAELGDMPQRPANSLVDELLTPVDRTVFLRQLRYQDSQRKPPPPDQ